MVLWYIKTIKSGIALETIQAVLNSDSTNYGNYINSEYTITNTDAKYSTVDLDTGLCNEYKSVESSYSKASGEITILTTGASDNFSLFGIYDMAGNMFEWTLEYSSDPSYPCVGRGGYCFANGNDFPASSRDCDTTNSYHFVGFRSSLF